MQKEFPVHGYSSCRSCAAYSEWLFYVCVWCVLFTWTCWNLQIVLWRNRWSASTTWCVEQDCGSFAWLLCRGGSCALASLIIERFLTVIRSIMTFWKCSSEIFMRAKLHTGGFSMCFRGFESEYFIDRRTKVRNCLSSAIVKSSCLSGLKRSVA